jgi:hypothetical protein
MALPGRANFFYGRKKGKSDFYRLYGNYLESMRKKNIMTGELTEKLTTI